MILPYQQLKIRAVTDITVRVGRGKHAADINRNCCGFDIETTNDPQTESAYMYIWQFAVDGQAYFGRTWEEFEEFLEILRDKFSGKIIIWVHNMGFEMSFLLPRLYRANQIERLFAKAEREPLEVETKNGFIFKDSMALTNMSLKALAKAYCTTQKLVGDLDYSIMRNSKTPLTDKEFAYCENDVLILSEFAEYIHQQYTDIKAKIPYTSTGIVRRLVKKQLPGKLYRYAQQKVCRLFPATIEKYDYTMQWLFRGAFCHAQTAICDETLSGVHSHDLKSAYPAEMCHRLYPMTPFKPVPPDTALAAIRRGMAVIMLVSFYGITATGAHVLESSHKILEEVGAEFENGRLYYADKVTVFITDVDFKIYSMMYKWDKLEIHGAKTAVKKSLPEYLLKPLFEVYEQKETVGAQLKADSDNADLRQLYQATKGKLNSFYGMTVARLNLTAAEYKGAWVTVPSSTYEDERDNSILSPYWGIYVTAYTRLTICTAIVALGESAYYSDTDSIKHKAPDFSYFDGYNNQIEKINKAMCKQYELNFDVFKRLGTFDFEGTYTRFKTLGAKRYITEESGEVHSTVAGLPKSVFSEYAHKVGNDKAFENFKPNLAFEISGKNAHIYNDETSAEIAGEIMHEYGNCYIFSVPFCMRVDTGFLLAITKRKRLQDYVNS